MGLSFSDKIAVVTGGGSGIGAALCLGLAARGVRHVHVADRNLDGAEQVAEQVRAAGGSANAIGLDVTDGLAVEAAVPGMEASTGPIDLWFSNAGVNLGDGLGTAEDWRRSLDVNVMGHVHAAAAILPRMASRGGAFTITASAAGLLCDIRTAPYSASKHAAVALAEWLAIRHGGGDVQVHCACPEGVRTAMTKDSSGAVGGDFIAAEAAAEAILNGVASGNFLILTHPRTGEFEGRRVSDRPRWLAGMRKFARAVLAEPSTELEETR